MERTCAARPGGCDAHAFTPVQEARKHEPSIGNGFRGPYALALSPTRYNRLFRRYEGSDMLQLDHLSRLCEAGVYKAPFEDAVLLDPRLGRIDIGQDLQVGYSANDGIHCRLFASESLVLLLDDPQAICTLE
jgi:uncharacterized linocin/CFP29 family protein